MERIDGIHSIKVFFEKTFHVLFKLEKLLSYDAYFVQGSE